MINSLIKYPGIVKSIQVTQFLAAKNYFIPVTHLFRSIKKSVEFFNTNNCTVKQVIFSILFPEVHRNVHEKLIPFNMYLPWEHNYYYLQENNSTNVDMKFAYMS